MMASRTVVSILLAFSLLSAGLLIAQPVRGKSVTILIEARDINFRPAEIRVDPGDDVTIRFFNNESNSGIPHTFDLDEFDVHIGTRAAPLQKGQQGNGSFAASRNGTFWFHCDIPSHSFGSGDGSWSGMAGRIIVGTGSPASPLNVIAIAIAAVIVVGAGGATALIFLRRKK